MKYFMMDYRIRQQTLLKQKDVKNNLKKKKSPKKNKL